MKARFLALAALVLGLASCQTEPEGLNVNVGGEVDTTITVTIPDTETRAGGNNSAEGVFDNGILGANDVTMRYILQVFQGVEANDGTTTWKASKETKFEYSDERETITFDVRLVPGRDYKFVVWADVVKKNDQGEWADLHYNTHNGDNDVTDLTKVTLKDTWVAMDESRDAFTGVKLVKDYSSSSTINFQLTRPFAKLRIVTTDVEALTNLGIEPNNAVVTYTTPYYYSFNALTEEYTKGDATKTHTYTIESYGDNDKDNMVLYTDYLFVKNDVVKFSLTVKENGGKLIKHNDFTTDIPVQRNYLTTIQGNVLTDGNNVSVKVEDAFKNGSEWNPGDDKYDVEVWDGKSISVPSQDSEGNYTVKTPSELAWLAAAVNGTLETRAAAADSFDGKTFVLTQDIDLGNEPWTPIGNATTSFQGTFDGNGKTIANLVVNGYNTNAGLFGFTTNGEIKNVTIENAKVSGRLNVGVVAGTPYTSKFTNITIKGHVEVNGMAYVGGVGGKNAYADWTNITVNVDETSYVKANSVENGTAYRTYVGGVVGFNGEGGHSFKNIKSNINVIGSTCDVGGLFGIAHYGNQFEECVCTGNVTITTDEVENALEMGGLAGVWHNENGQTVTFTNCSFTGELSTPNITEEVDFYYGGLIGAPYSATGTGKLIVDGYEMVAYGVLKTGENEYGIYGAHGLKWIADVVNATTPYTATLFDNATVKLMNDIDLNNQEWIPIGDDRSQRTEWHGVFDGNGFTVKNIKITKKTDRDDENKSSYGLFGNVKGTVKNLTVENVSISGAPKFIGALIGRLNGGLVENCHVKNSSVECENWTIGGLVGQFNNGKISGCTVEYTTVKGYAAVGGITGIALDKGERVIENCSVNSCTFVKNGSFGGDYDKMFGTIVGALYNGGLTVNLNNCTSSKNTLNGEAYSIPCGFITNGDTLLVNGGVYIADGLTYKTAEKAYYVTNANGLVALSSMTIKGNEVVELGADIDLTDVEFNGLSAFNPEPNNTFDGNNYTVSNWTNNTGASDMGFFKSWVGTIKNVKFENCHLKTAGRSAIVAANTYCNIENVHVNNSSIEDSYWACGIVAGLYNSGSISNCTVTNSSVKSNGGTGGIVGCINESAGTRSLTNCTVSNCTINNTGAYGEDYTGGGLVGIFNVDGATYKFVNCSVSNNTLEGAYVYKKYPEQDGIIEE